MYRGTVRGPEVTITTPDPCDLYEATVASQYMMPNLTCIGDDSPSKPLGGELLHYSGTTPHTCGSVEVLKFLCHKRYPIETSATLRSKLGSPFVHATILKNT